MNNLEIVLLALALTVVLPWCAAAAFILSDRKTPDNR
jgi:hypothetical protein